MNDEPGAAKERIAATQWWPAALAIAALLICIAIASQPGTTVFGAGFAAVVQTVIEAGFIPLAWLLGALGLGALVHRAIVGTPRVSWSLAAALGISVMLFLSHALGALGAFTGKTGLFLAWLPVATGLYVLWRALNGQGATNLPHGRERRLPLIALCALPAIAILVTAACAPPGTLWHSEALGYDALSYHLQLPKEWLALGRLVPLEHNVYSFLPSYTEAAYLHLFSMRGPWRDPLAGASQAVQSPQLLHALIAIMTAVVLARCAHLWCCRCTSTCDAHSATSTPTAAAAAILLLTPWVVVTGSLAYNEMPVLLCFAGALIAAVRHDIPAMRRGVIIGWLVGIACCSKLTAAYLVAPPVAIALVACSPRSQWIRVATGVTAAGILAMAPWLIRNALASGNPVFPFGSGLLGSAHWTAEQVARWHSAHTLSLSLTDRVSLFFSSRGILHAQWSLVWLIAPVAGIIALRVRATRRIAAVMLLCLFAQVVAWLFIGHLQSRFLLPALVPIAVLIALAIAGAQQIESLFARRAVQLTSIALCLLLAAHTSIIFLHQNRTAGGPNVALVAGPALFTGELAKEALPTLTPGDRRTLLASLPPSAFVNIVLRQSSDRKPLLYLLGDATPLYFRVPVLYHTTWDSSPLAQALAKSGGDLPRALSNLHDEYGVTHILINFDELHRLIGIDRWYDPRVTLDIAADILRLTSPPIQSWTSPDRAGSSLISLDNLHTIDSR